MNRIIRDFEETKEYTKSSRDFDEFKSSDNRIKKGKDPLKEKEDSSIDSAPLTPASKVRKAMLFSRNSYILDQNVKSFLKFKKKIENEDNFPPQNFENFQTNTNPNLNIQERECDESIKQGNPNQENEYYNASVSKEHSVSIDQSDNEPEDSQGIFGD